MKLPKVFQVVTLASATIALFGLVVTPIFAQIDQQAAGNGFRISPVRSDLVIEAGQSETITLTLENPADVPTTARAIVNDFIASDSEDGEPRLILDESAEAPRNSFRSLVGSIDDVELPARERVEIAVNVRVPENANAGGYYGAIRFAPVADGGNTGNVGLTASVGTIILVRVPGDLAEKLNLIELSAAQNGVMKSFMTSGDVSVITRLENDGDIHLRPIGKVAVKNMFGKTVAEYELNQADVEQDRASILPGSIRRFENQLEQQSWLGRYTIEANLGFTGGGSAIFGKTSFWYLPPWAIAVITLLLVGIIGGGYVAYRKLSNRPQHGKKKR